MVNKDPLFGMMDALVESSKVVCEIELLVCPYDPDCFEWGYCDKQRKASCQKARDGK
jgi:hypothetical protein